MSSVIERYQYHQDPGHGWVEVPLEDCVGHRVSSYSYWGYGSDGCLVAYLEEDLDAVTVLGSQVVEVDGRAYAARPRTCVELRYVLEPVQHPKDCFIRGLERFPAAASNGFDIEQVFAVESSLAADIDAARKRNAAHLVLVQALRSDIEAALESSTQGEPLGGVCSECEGSGSVVAEIDPRQCSCCDGSGLAS